MSEDLLAAQHSQALVEKELIYTKKKLAEEKSRNDQLNAEGDAAVSKRLKESLEEQQVFYCSNMECGMTTGPLAL